MLGRTKRLGAGLVFVAFVSTPLTLVGAPTAGSATSTVPVQRIYGTDAIGTSIAVSQAEYPSAGSAKAVVLARSDFFADALAGGPLAAKVGGPLLITPGASLSTALDPRVQAEIQRVLPVGDTVYILGGDLALSPNIDSELQGLGYVTQRIAGSDEYGTAVDIAEQLGNPTTIFEATGLSFQDALSAVPAAIKDQGAILLTDGPVQDPETASYLADHPGDTRYAIGGPLAAAGADPSATAVYGTTLYDTSATVASTFFPSATVFGAATGTNFPDALSGGVFMGQPGTQGPMLLVEPSGPLPTSIDSYLTGTLSTLTQGYLFGGPLAVGNDVLTELGSPQSTVSASVAFVQADDTGTINGNDTSIASGQSNQVLAHDTGIGHSVVLMIQTLTSPGTETDTVTSVSSAMGTFHFVNSYNDGADFEIWVCMDTTGAADTVTVTTPTNAWDAFAVEFNAPATGYLDGGGQVVDLPYLGDQSWTVSPGATGNIAVIGVDTADAYETGPAAPWSYYNSGYWSFSNGTSAAWQVAPSSSPLTATWVQDGGESSSQGVVLEY
jgi:hypothetical protein